MAELRRFFSGTLFSRISGFGRDLIMAFAFGDHPSVAAFMIAFRFSNLLRRLVAEGPIQITIIPYFEGLRIKNHSKALLFFLKLLFLVTISLLGITILVELGISYFLSLETFSAYREVYILTRWLFPAIIFICLYGLNTCLLHCYDSFFVPSFAPFICNSIWITAAFLLKNKPAEYAMVSLAKWVCIGFICQWLFTLPKIIPILKRHFKEKLNRTALKISTEVKQLLSSFSFGAIGIGAMQINSFIDGLFARHAHTSGPVYLWYSIRIEQLALAIFGIACVSTIVPRLSRAIKQGDKGKAETLFALSYKRILLVMIPCTFAIFAIGGASTNFIYGRGSFSEAALLHTTICLWSYAIGLLPTTMVILFSSLFYSNSNFRTPTIASLLSVVMNLILNALFVFVFKWGVASIALATSLSAWGNFLLIQRLNRSFKVDCLHGIAKGLLVTLLALLFTTTVNYFFLHATLFLPFFPRSLSLQVSHLCIQSITFFGSLIGFSYLFEYQDLLELLRTFLPSSFAKQIE